MHDEPETPDDKTNAEADKLKRLLDSDDNNVIRMPSLAERDRMRREKEKAVKEAAKAQKEPFWGSAVRSPRSSRGGGAPAAILNIPVATKFFMAAIVIVHAVNSFVLSPAQLDWVYTYLGFVPGRYTGSVFVPSALWAAVLSPLTYMFIHGSWLHVIMNGVMLMAFGSGVERWLGAKKMLILFTGCSLVAVLVHFLVEMESIAPVIGASGGLSGLFAAILLLMKQTGATGNSRYGLWPFIIIWVLISVGFGMAGGPGGSQIAWIAHLGGFFAGFILLKPVMALKI